MNAEQEPMGAPGTASAPGRPKPDPAGQAATPGPTIYAYTTEAEKRRPWTHRSGGRGRIKVGYTERDVRERVREQENSPETPRIPFEAAASTEDGESFSDRDVHEALERLGAYRLTREESGARSEWFEATVDEIRRAWSLVHTKGRSEAPLRFRMRPEQERAVEAAATHFRSHPDSRDRHFLWNAKMRFGKTFAAYQLAREMGWRRVLVLTFKPAAEGAWREIIEQHADFEDWQFVGNQEGWDAIEETRPIAQIVSFQNLMGRDSQGLIKNSLELVHAEDWDCIVVDEYHFGAWRDGAKDLYDLKDKRDREEAEDTADYRKGSFPVVDGESLAASHWLYLSGTPFRALAQGEFLEEQIFNWTYADEQTQKRLNANDPGSPYADLPGLEMYAYRMGDTVRDHATRTFDDEFDLGAFFKATKKAGISRFERERDVQQWLDWLHRSAGPGEPPSCAPYATPKLREPLRHTVWFLPDVASCTAMKALLDEDAFFRDFEVVVAAGAKAGSGIRALAPVEYAIGDGTRTKTITLTCGKLMTGVTVPQWGGIFVLRNLNAAETYFQAAFRVQSPWSDPDPHHPGRRTVKKETAYIFDFAPQRALDLIATYCGSLAGGDRDQPREVTNFLNFLPVLCYDDGRMVRLDARELLDVAYSGIGSAMLARRWQSPQLVKLDRDTLSRLLDNEALCDAISQMEAFRELRRHARRVVNADDALAKARRERKKPDPETKKEQKEAKKKRIELRDKLLQFLCKVPLFMYLTDLREESLVDVIRKVETPLFVKVTGLELEHFDQLCEVGVFNERALDESIYAFRRQEAVHLPEKAP